MTSKIHPTAVCEARDLGEGVVLGPFSHVAASSSVGELSEVGDRVSIAAGARLMKRVKVGVGSSVGADALLEDDVQLGANCVVCGPETREGIAPVPTVVRARATVGDAAVVGHGVTVGTGAVVRPGAIVTRSVPPCAVVAGNPAQIVGYTQASLPAEVVAPVSPPAASGRVAVGVGEVALHRVRAVRDLRGELAVGEFARELPFIPQRYFLVYDVPSAEVRGEHAHWKCHQLLICARGAISVVVDDGKRRAQVRLDDPSLALHIPPMVWAVQYGHTPDATLLVFASEPYESADYIRDYDEFVVAVRAPREGT